jgi:riboflavin biosynthesis pyrimidine reductase
MLRRSFQTFRLRLPIAAEARATTSSFRLTPPRREHAAITISVVAASSALVSVPSARATANAMRAKSLAVPTGSVRAPADKPSLAKLSGGCDPRLRLRRAGAVPFRDFQRGWVPSVVNQASARQPRSYVMCARRRNINCIKPHDVDNVSLQR